MPPGGEAGGQEVGVGQAASRAAWITPLLVALLARDVVAQTPPDDAEAEQIEAALTASETRAMMRYRHRVRLVIEAGFGQRFKQQPDDPQPGVALLASWAPSFAAGVRYAPVPALDAGLHGAPGDRLVRAAERALPLVQL